MEMRGFAAEIRAESGADCVMLHGYAAVFNSRSERIGGKRGFWEIIQPGAFRRSLESGRGRDMIATVEHDPSKVLGRRSAGTLTAAEDAHGLKVSVALSEASYARDLAIAVRRGDVRGMSFGFDCVKDEWSEAGELRSLKEVEVMEVTFTPMPVYGDTEVAMRSREMAEHILGTDLRRHARMAILLRE